jgi:hypothetical protein
VKNTLDVSLSCGPALDQLDLETLPSRSELRQRALRRRDVGINLTRSRQSEPPR